MEVKHYNKIIVVDEHNNVIGSEDMLVAREKGQLRRASRVFLFNESGDLLVQRRSKDVLDPLLLDQSAAGHVDEGETFFEAAKRELFEELGLEVELEEITTSLRTKGFFSGVYRAVISNKIEINFNQEEVDSLKWYTINDLENDMKDKPHLFTPPFLEAWSILRDRLITT